MFQSQNRQGSNWSKTQTRQLYSIILAVFFPLEVFFLSFSKPASKSLFFFLFPSWEDRFVHRSILSPMLLGDILISLYTSTSQCFSISQNVYKWYCLYGTQGKCIWSCSGFEVTIGESQAAPRAEGAISSGLHRQLYPHIGCEAVVKANHYDFISLTRNWFWVNIWPIAGQWGWFANAFLQKLSLLLKRDMKEGTCFQAGVCCLEEWQLCCHHEGMLP